MERSTDLTLGLAETCVVKPGNFGLVAYAMMSAPTLGGVFDRIARYIGILSDCAAVEVIKGGEWRRVALTWRDERRTPPWQRFAFSLLTFLTFCRWVTGRTLEHVTVELTHPPTPGVRPFFNSIGVALRFDAANCAIAFPEAEVTKPLPTANSLLSETHERIADERLAQISGASITDRVREAISRLLPEGEPSRVEVAKALAMSERTLHRRLAAEEASFLGVLEATRRHLAKSYLARGELSLADVTFLLGFKDQSSFFRSVKRWFGMTPRQYRKQVAPQPATGRLRQKIGRQI